MRPTLPFHLAFPVRDLASTRAFYGTLLGCPELHASDDSLEYDFFGHQLVAHVAPDEAAHNARLHLMGDDDVPPRHFGALFDWEEWPRWVTRLRLAGVKFLVEPCVLDKGQRGEQATVFFADPSGNVLEFKSFRDGRWNERPRTSAPSASPPA